MTGTSAQTSTQQDTPSSTEAVAITVFGRLALLRAQVDAALDDEFADRQDALERVSEELARILDLDLAGEVRAR